MPSPIKAEETKGEKGERKRGSSILLKKIGKEKKKREAESHYRSGGGKGKADKTGLNSSKGEKGERKEYAV